MSEIHKVGFDAAGDARSEGRYAVHPDGHVIVIPPLAPLKDGFRWASREDIDNAGKPAPEPVAEVAPEPDPPEVSFNDEHDEHEHSE